jgi:restriction system protein
MFEDIVEIVTMLPWWCGVTLAVVFYVWLHHVASQPIPPATDLKNISANVGAQLWKTLAMFGQYILPVACLMGAGLSAYGRNQRRVLHHEVSMAPSRRALESMSWRQFEMLVGEVFRRKGFKIEERGGNGPDGGVDLSLRLGSDLYLVQCKQWKAMRVGVATVRELYGVMAAEHAVGGFVVASGDFTEDAQQFAEGRTIEIVGTDQLLDLIEETAGESIGEIRASITDTPSCPSCGASMIRRTAKRGANAGGQFWGCSNYPDCRGIQ